MWRVEQEPDVIKIFYYTRGWQQEGAAKTTSGEPSYGPGCREPDSLKPAGTWVGVSARMYNDLTSLGDRAKEGRGSEGRHAGTGEGISARMHVANPHADRVEDGHKRDCRHNANSLWERVAPCISVGVSIVVAYVGGRGEGVSLSTGVRCSTEVGN